jgi:predicted TIM-barrel fold metal-dependent hydrolase
LEHRAWGGVRDTIPEPPSTYYKDRIFGCFFRDKHGLRSLDEIGENQVTFETDYPHTDSTWPYTKKIFAEQVAHLDDERVYKIARGNAINMLRLSPEGLWKG